MLFGSTLPKPVTVNDIVLSAFFRACIIEDLEGRPTAAWVPNFLRTGVTVSTSDEVPSLLKIPLIVGGAVVLVLAALAELSFPEN